MNLSIFIDSEFKRRSGVPWAGRPRKQWRSFERKGGARGGVTPRTVLGRPEEWSGAHWEVLGHSGTP